MSKDESFLNLKSTNKVCCFILLGKSLKEKQRFNNFFIFYKYIFKYISLSDKVVYITKESISKCFDSPYSLSQLVEFLHNGIPFSYLFWYLINI